MKYTSSGDGEGSFVLGVSAGSPRSRKNPARFPPAQRRRKPRHPGWRNVARLFQAEVLITTGSNEIELNIYQTPNLIGFVADPSTRGVCRTRQL
jgi:hypothetical protein